MLYFSRDSQATVAAHFHRLILIIVATKPIHYLKEQKSLQIRKNTQLQQCEKTKFVLQYIGKKKTL